MMLSFLDEPLATKLRGGWRLRNRQRQAAPIVMKSSKLAMKELAKWCDGHSTTVQMVLTCQSGYDDGIRRPALCRLALRTDGSKFWHRKRPQNTLRQIMQMFEKQPSVSRFLTYLSEGSIKVFVKPSAMIAYVHQNFPKKFKRIFGAEEAKLVQFWREFLASEDGKAMAELNPFLKDKNPEELSKSIPLVIHEDAGPYAKGKSMNIINFSSLLANGAEHDTKLCIATHVKDPEHADVKNIEVFWRELIKDFEELANGTSEIHFRNGDKWTAILLFGKGDMEMRVVTWGLPGWKDVDEICPSCLANRTTRPYTDNGPNAGWRRTIAQPNEFFLLRLAEPRHPLTLSKFFNKFFPILDVMHMLDCKGVTAHAAGSVLKYLVVNCDELGSTQAERLANLNQNMKSFQSTNKTPSRMPQIYLNNLTDGSGWADLTSQLVKAANTRNLVPWLVSLCPVYFNADTNFDKAVTTMLRSLNEIYEIMYKAGFFFTQDESRKFSALILKFGIRYQWLRSFFQSREQLYFAFMHKHHAMQHLPQVARLINPIKVQCYAEEGAVGRIAKIWKASKHGPYKKRIQVVVLTKILIRTELRLKDT